MRSFPATVDDARLRRGFKVFATAEALSWLALLITMYFKWIVIEDPHAGSEGGVPIAGPIHGVMFLMYCLYTLLCANRFNWIPRTTVLGLAASLPPFATYFFERRVERLGLLRVV